MYKSFMRGSYNLVQGAAENAGSAALAFVPAIALTSFWLGGEGALIGVALGLPLVLVFAGNFQSLSRQQKTDSQPLRSLDKRSQLELVIEKGITQYLDESGEALCLMVSVSSTSCAKQTQLIGHRLKSVVRRSDVVCEYRPNQFAICILDTEAMTVDFARDIAFRLHQAAKRPLLINRQTVAPQITVGFSLIGTSHDTTAEGILDSADRALTYADQNCRGQICAYDRTMGGQTLQSELVAEVHTAFDNGDIVAWFQPQFQVKDRSLAGAEALVRWKHPKHGMISPQEFLSAIQKAGAWSRLTDHMVTSALDAVLRLEDVGIRLPTVGVNFAQEDLDDIALVDRITWAVDKAELSHDRLTIEVLESVVAMGSECRVAQTLLELSRLGCPIDLDDFGTGQASIASLRDYKLDRVKIDRSFVTDADSDPAQEAMLETILLMAHRLGFDTLAEGVETTNELAVLKKFKCGGVQGFGLAKPMPLDELIKWATDEFRPDSRAA